MYRPEGFADEIFKLRYASHAQETWEEACKRVATHVAMAEEGDAIADFKDAAYSELVNNRFMPGGRIWYGSGKAKGQLLNCFVVPAGDSREAWGQTVSDTIVISGTGGGVGINCTPVRPRGSAIQGTGGTATGAVSLMELIERSSNREAEDALH